MLHLLRSKQSNHLVLAGEIKTNRDSAVDMQWPSTLDTPADMLTVVLAMNISPPRAGAITRVDNGWAISPGDYFIDASIKRSVDLFGQLMQHGESLTLFEFADRIREHASSHPDANVVAMALTHMKSRPQILQPAVFGITVNQLLITPQPQIMYIPLYTGEQIDDAAILLARHSLESTPVDDFLLRHKQDIILHKIGSGELPKQLPSPLQSEIDELRLCDPLEPQQKEVQISALVWNKAGIRLPKHDALSIVENGAKTYRTTSQTLLEKSSALPLEQLAFDMARYMRLYGTQKAYHEVADVMIHLMSTHNTPAAAITTVSAYLRHALSDDKPRDAAEGYYEMLMHTVRTPLAVPGKDEPLRKMKWITDHAGSVRYDVQGQREHVDNFIRAVSDIHEPGMEKSTVFHTLRHIQHLSVEKDAAWFAHRSATTETIPNNLALDAGRAQLKRT